MNYKRHWNEKQAITSVYCREDSGCKSLEVDMIKLKAGESIALCEIDKEQAVLILDGTVNVIGDKMNYENIGARKNVFDGKAYAVYVPRNLKFEIIAVTEARVCISKCPTTEDYEPVLVTPDDIIVKNLGKPGFEREVHLIVDERLQASKIYVGENFIKGGQWSGYPGHKHDVENLPTEGKAEEIYYYEFDKETGYGVQQVYTADRSTDEIYTVRNRDLVEVPYGYHPLAVAPGYNGYLLWMMCCESKRALVTTLDPEQDWIVK
jgi:5-deoxy-glucuronate isomerase